jgi:hypothetical protein
MFHKLVLLSTLAVASGFAPGIVGRRVKQLYMSEDMKLGTVKWWVFETADCG